jgi:hypothetical protein
VREKGEYKCGKKEKKRPFLKNRLFSRTYETDANERNERSRLETRRKEPPGRVLSRDGTLHTNT